MLLCPKELHVARSKIWFSIPAVLLWQDSGIYRAEVTEAASEMLGLLGLIFDAVATECITTYLIIAGYFNLLTPLQTLINCTHRF